MNECFIVIYEWIRLFFHVGLYPYWGTLLYTFIFAVIWCASGFLAATIAEMKGHNVLLHFAGGLLVPYVYPITLVFVLHEKFGENQDADNFNRLAAKLDATSFEITEKIKQNRIKKKLDKLGIDIDSEEAKEILAEEEKVFAKHNAVITASTQEDMPSEPEEPVEELAEGEDLPIVMGKAYFDSIAVNEIGERCGPFDLELKNGNMIVAEIIAGTLDDIAIFETIDHNGKTKRIRMKYENIASCVLRARD
jgi:hypothetical protein